MTTAYHPITLGDAGVLRPGRLRRLRALGWMVLLFAALSALLCPGWARHGPLARIAPELLRVAGVLLSDLAYAAAVRFGERRTPDELAPAPLLRELGLGVAIGAGMFALVFATLRLSGAYTLEPARWSDWPRDTLSMLRVAFGEELLLRLVVFRLLMRAGGLWVALVASAALFGFLHLGNPNAGLVAAAAIAIEAGLMLAAFYLVIGRIWMAVGVHAAWNLTQGSVFGARVSGSGDAGSLFVSTPVAGVPVWWSGGAFGPEASLPAVIVGAAIFALVLRAALKHHGATRSACASAR